MARTLPMPSTCAAAATRAPDYVPLRGAPFADKSSLHTSPNTLLSHRYNTKMAPKRTIASTNRTTPAERTARQAPAGLSAARADG